MRSSGLFDPQTTFAELKKKILFVQMALTTESLYGGQHFLDLQKNL